MPTRRTFIKSAAVAAAAGLAGCMPNRETVDELPRPFLGAEDATTVVQSFEDFMCPACRDYNQNQFPQIREELIETNEIRYEHYDYPLPVAPQLSRPAHIAGRSVQDNGSMEQFWQFNEAFFEAQPRIGSLPNIAQVAGEATDVPSDTVLQDMRARVYNPVIEADIQAGQERDVRGTPAVFVDGSLVRPPNPDEIARIVRDNQQQANLIQVVHSHE